MMLLTLRGTPTVYYGDEIGLENGVIPPEKIQDPQGINLGAERTRDVTRTPMQWDAGPNAGFSSVEPWLPVSADYTVRNVEAQSDDPYSMLTFYKRLFWLRRGSPALFGGSYRALDVAGDCYVYLRESGDQKMLVALNFGGQPVTIQTGLEGQGRVLLSTHLERKGTAALSGLSLDAYEGVIIAL
jgi:alpha-glucosidase